MCRQVFRPARRAVVSQILGACTTDKAHRTDAPRDQARVRLLAHAHDAIDALLQQDPKTALDNSAGVANKLLEDNRKKFGG